MMIFFLSRKNSTFFFLVCWFSCFHHNFVWIYKRWQGTTFSSYHFKNKTHLRFASHTQNVTKPIWFFSSLGFNGKREEKQKNHHQPEIDVIIQKMNYNKFLISFSKINFEFPINFKKKFCLNCSYRFYCWIAFKSC